MANLQSIYRQKEPNRALGSPLRRTDSEETMKHEFERCGKDGANDLFGGADAPSNASARETEMAQKTAALDRLLEVLPYSLLAAAMKSRGYVVADFDTLDKLHDAYWTDRNAHALVREWIRKTTGRL
jgi:hypothetical protein